MKNIFFSFFFLTILNLTGEDMEKNIKPPVPKKEPYIIEKHGDKRIDNYFWMKNRDSKEVMDYLIAENEYTANIMSDFKELSGKIYSEMRSRIKEADISVPFKYGNYYYYREYLEGKDYPIYKRKNLNGKEEILLDVNDLAKDKKYCHVKNVLASPDGKLIGYAVDEKGRRFYTVYFKEIETGRILEDKIIDITGNFVWANDNKTVFYTKQNPETLRAERFMKHKIGGKEDEEIYFEKDETFELYPSKSKSERFIFLISQSTLSTEVRYILADTPDSDLKLFHKREKELEYFVEDGGDVFFVLNNDGAKNFKVSVVGMQNTGKENWKDYIPGGNALIENMDVFKNWLVLLERENAKINFKIINRKNKESYYIAFQDECYSALPAENMEYNSDKFRYYYESLITPYSVIEYNMLNKISKTLKMKEVPGYDREKYITQRLWFKARDGEKVPVSVVYKKDFRSLKPKKLLVYGYGSYGLSVDTNFDSNIFSLIDRGFAYAIIHIRGGSELGRRWYEDGRQLKKMNTFNDFIDGTKFLIENGYGDKGHIYANGASAGGLLMGAITNIAGELYNGIIAEVPFVDVLTTMLDENIPLTTGEYDEWGNPNIKEYYDYMKLYSPYDNVSKKAYPNMLITAGYYDSQVQYWEPAKWAAKIRENNISDSLVLLKTDMSAGHSGKTGRFKYLEDEAFKYSFILKLEKINE